jgi:hypothetical protein
LQADGEAIDDRPNFLATKRVDGPLVEWIEAVTPPHDLAELKYGLPLQMRSHGVEQDDRRVLRIPQLLGRRVGNEDALIVRRKVVAELKLRLHRTDDNKAQQRLLAFSW